MLARRSLFRLALSLFTLVLLMSFTAQVAEAAQPSMGCRNCGGGGGGGQLTTVEIEGLTYMREEEKLARDSYLILYDKWHLSIFAKIANSEVMHMAKVKDLLDRYGLADPVAGKAIGAFSNPVLQQLYNELIAQGSQSSTAALRVGVTIETVDIQDLQKYRAATSKTDILNVYSSLLNGSYCHLNAFNNQLGQ